jgi:hypothetical protein
MRRLLSATFALGLTRASAVDLSPVESPYAILARITVALPTPIDGRAAQTGDDFVPTPDKTPAPPSRFRKSPGLQQGSLARPRRHVLARVVPAKPVEAN